MKKVQAIICKCGKSFAGCLEPYCYENVEWIKDVRKYVKKGCEIKLIDQDKFQMELCECNKKKNDNQLELFNQ